jgi:hypothetical protein
LTLRHPASASLAEIDLLALLLLVDYEWRHRLLSRSRQRLGRELTEVFAILRSETTLVQKAQSEGDIANGRRARFAGSQRASGRMQPKHAHEA